MCPNRISYVSNLYSTNLRLMGIHHTCRNLGNCFLVQPVSWHGIRLGNGWKEHMQVWVSYVQIYCINICIYVYICMNVVVTFAIYVEWLKCNSILIGLPKWRSIIIILGEPCEEGLAREYLSHPIPSIWGSGRCKSNPKVGGSNLVFVFSPCNVFKTSCFWPFFWV